MNALGLTPSSRFDAWVGRTQEQSKRIAPEPVAAMAATLDWSIAPALGDPLPPGWQWLFFNPFTRSTELGPDGHPRRGGFLPPIELPRRMWAGSRIAYRAPLPVGADAVRVSRIERVESKQGRSGPLVFLTLRHTTRVGSCECIVEEQDIVYRGMEDAPAAIARPAAGNPPATGPAPADVQRVATDPVLLFRYSALTFNGHRIHYDEPYARSVEGYPGLVVHGPLTATVLQQFAAARKPHRWLASFEFRGQQPLFVGETMTLQAVEEGCDSLVLQALGDDGRIAMRATASFDPAASA